MHSDTKGLLKSIRKSFRRGSHTSNSYSPFLSLPFEIRLAIYTQAFSTTSGSDITIKIEREDRLNVYSRYDNTLNPNRPTSLKCTCAPNISLPVALFRTNSQLYNEALPILYENITLAPSPHGGALQEFTDRISDFARGYIHRVKLYPDVLLTDLSSPYRERECLSWAMMCSQLSRFQSLREIQVIYSSVHTLTSKPVKFHRARYAMALDKLPVKKTVAFHGKNIDAGIDSQKASRDYQKGGREFFRELFLVAS